MTEETTELRVEQRHIDAAFAAEKERRMRESIPGTLTRVTENFYLSKHFACFERDHLTRPAAVDADGGERGSNSAECRHAWHGFLAPNSWGVACPSCGESLTRPQAVVGLALLKSCSFAGSVSPPAVTLHFHNQNDRDAFIDAHVDAIRHTAQGTSGSAQDAKRLDPKGAGPVAESDAP